MKELIEERTYAKGGFFKLNPKVEDIPDKYCCEYKGIKLLLMSRMKYSSGCYCPENALLRSLIQHLLLERNEVVIMDMEAGVEHLSRGTASEVENFIIVVEPTRTSLQTAHRINYLTKTLGVGRVLILGNKIQTPDEIKFIRENAPPLEILGFLPFDEKILHSSKIGTSPYDTSSKLKYEIIKIKQRLVKDGC
jgi:CO dehydrogenase maturation factor